MVIMFARQNQRVIMTELNQIYKDMQKATEYRCPDLLESFTDAREFGKLCPRIECLCRNPCDSLQ